MNFKFIRLIIYSSNPSSFFPDVMEDGIDIFSLKETDFNRICTYIVQDRPCPDVAANRAHASLPRNLVLKPSLKLADVSCFFIDSFSKINTVGLHPKVVAAIRFGETA
jgi:hypothetical protein